MPRRKLSVALLTLGALMAAACSSTVGPQDPQAAPSDDPSALAPSEIPKGARVNDKGEIINKKGKVIGTVDTTGSAGGVGGDSSVEEAADAASGSTAKTGYTKGGHEFGPGVTDKYILVGYAVNNNSKAGCELAGTCSIGADTRGMEDDFADWFNKHGGIAGRKIKLVKFEYSTTEGTTSEQIGQRICTYFTEDHPVFAGIGEGSDENFNRCMNRGGVTLIGASRTGLDAKGFNSAPYVYLTGGLHLTNAGLVQAKGLLEAGYFKKPDNAKVGLVTYDHPTHLRAASTFKRTLATGGGKIAEQVNIYYPNSISDISRMDAEIQSAVLRFKTEGVTHVTFLTADGGSLPLLFIRHAQDQNYFPRYGFNSSAGSATMVEGGGGINIERRNFIGAVTVGWFPAGDVNAGQKYRNPPAFPECKAIGAKYGRPATTTNEKIVIANFCDFFRFLKAGIEAGLPNITPDSFRAGVESLGRSWAPAGAHLTAFGPTSHDGAGAYQVNRYYDKCECFKPSGPIKRFK